MTLSKRYHSLDLLKFALAVCIALHHLQQLTSIGSDVFRFYGGAVNFAYCVEFFFMISGFLSYRKIGEIEKKQFHEYIGSKLKRLYPMCFISMIAMTVLYWIYFLVNGEWLPGLLPDLFKIFSSLLLLSGTSLAESGRSLNSPLWYISVLMICYMLLWVSAKSSTKQGRRFIYYALALCVIGEAIHTCGFDLPFINESTARGYSAFFYGVILSWLYDHLNVRKLTKLAYSVLILCCVLALYDYPSFYRYERGALTYVFFPAVLFTLLSIDKYFHPSIAKILGAVSFEMYVWHLFIIVFLQIILSIEGFRNAVLNMNGLLFMVLYVFIVLVFSLFMYLKWEKAVNDRFTKTFSGFLKKQEADTNVVD